MLPSKAVVINAALLALLTLTALELAFQLAFPQLPAAIIEQMPQFRQRMGYRLDAAHGVQEYPANQIVGFEITRSSGDLYKLTCLSPDDAPPFDAYRVSFQRDSHGFRNPEPWPDQVDLVVIGDSFTAAEAIARPFWHGISDSMLVLGLPGSGTMQQQRLLEAHGLPRKPNAVVLAFFGGNDLQDNLAFFRMLEEKAGGNGGAHAGKTPLDYSVLFNISLAFRNRLFDDGQAACHFPQVAVTEPPTSLAFYDQFLATFALDRQAIQESEMFVLTRNAIDAMASALAASGSRLILMYIPQKAELYWELLSDESKADILTGSRAFDAAMEQDSISANLPALRDLMTALAAELRIDFLDLTRHLSKAVGEGVQPYFFSDTHWNQTGHNIARNALLDFLNQSNLEM